MECAVRKIVSLQHCPGFARARCFPGRGHLDTVENEPERSSTHCQTHEGLDVNLCAIIVEGLSERTRKNIALFQAQKSLPSRVGSQEESA
jgi:hypothetical protein